MIALRKTSAYKYGLFGKNRNIAARNAGKRDIRNKAAAPFAYIAALTAALLLAGVFAGAVFANLMDSGSYEAVGSYISGFFSSFDKNAINQKAVFIDSFYKYSRIIAVIWLAGFFAPGFVIIVCLLAFKAFAYGFTTAALIKYFGFYGFVIGFSSYVPQNLFFLPAMIMTASSAFSAICGRALEQPLSGSFPKEADGAFVFKFGLKSRTVNFQEYLIVLITGVLCCACAALTETYLTPAFIEYIRPV